MEIGLLTAAEWPWVLQRTTATAQAQVAPLLQPLADQQTVAGQAAGMIAQTVSQPGSAVLVAREGGRPVGYLIVALLPDELTAIPTGLFLDIYVEPEWRGKGISSALTAAGEQHCRQLGARAVRRVIAAHNTASLRHAQADGCQTERIILIKWL